VFNYDKIKGAHASNDSFWTSYSDLFLGLSSIFLLLYVVASLRTGTDAVKSQAENQKLSQRVVELEQQIKMYESVKKDYLAQKASSSEVQEYQELMDKLTLLQSEADEEKRKLLEQSQDNARKEQALNKYQQMVRNIINANKLAKTQLNARDEVIGEQDTKIDTQTRTIDTQTRTIATREQDLRRLQGDIENKKKQIEEGERRILAVDQELERRQAQLKRHLAQQKISKQAYEAKMRDLKSESDKRLQDLQAAQAKFESEAQRLSAAQSHCKANFAARKPSWPKRERNEISAAVLRAKSRQV
jgi:chromosome segregation ATPase